MATQPPAQMQQNSRAMQTPQPSILYVEHDVALAHLFKEQMEQEGFSVELAHTGPEGLGVLNRKRYDLIILDYQLPELNGIQLLYKLMENENHPPTIMVTAENDVTIVVEALRLGISDYIIKSTGAGYLQQVPSVIDRVIQDHRKQLERDAIVQDLHEQNQKLALLNRATQIFTSTLDEDQIASQLVSSICEFTNTEGSSVWLLGASELLECVAIYANDEYVEPRHVPLAPGQGVAGWAFANRETVLVNDAAHEPRFSTSSDAKLNFRTRTLLAVPLRAPDRVLGVLELVNKRSGKFTDADRILAETLAASAAIAIENARFFQDLNRQAEELRLRNEELDAFAHTVAHDLKTPLSLVAGYGDMLRENFTFLHPDEVIVYLQQIIDNSMRMNDIIESLLLLAGVRGALAVEIGPVNMQSIVAEAISRVEFMLVERNATVHIPDDWPLTMGYGPWLEEVWYNYIINALKYGGDPPEITLGFDLLDGSRVRFWLIDNGPGVSDDTSHLFKPMLRAPRSEGRKGYGLGLSIVKRIVERLQGAVGAENVPNGGSRFYFILPAAADEAE
jgi:signal transduction histidine kinase/DNA-binding response OmpR family regulator